MDLWSSGREVTIKAFFSHYNFLIEPTYISHIYIIPTSNQLCQGFYIFQPQTANSYDNVLSKVLLVILLNFEIFNLILFC